MSDDKQLERAGKKGLVAGLILGTIRRGNPNSSRLARPLAYGAGGYLTGTSLHLLAKHLIKPKTTTEQAANSYMANHLLQQKNTGIQKAAGQVTDGAQAVGGAAVAAKLASGVPSRMLGYHNIYHGTSKTNAEGIKKEGLNPRRGGFGGAGDTLSESKPKMAADYISKSKGQVHFSKSKRMANMFAGFVGSTSKGEAKQSDAIRAFFTGRHKGHTHNAIISDAHYRGAKIDKDASPIKNMAAKTHHGIRPEQIKDSPAYKGIKGVVNKNTLKRYYKGSAGRWRAARGLLLAGAAARAAGFAYDHGKKALGLQKKAGELFNAYNHHNTEFRDHSNKYYSVWDRPHGLSPSEWDELYTHGDNRDLAYDKMQAVIDQMNSKATGLASKPFDEATGGVSRAEYALKNAQAFDKDSLMVGAGTGLLATAGLSPLLKTNKAMAIGAASLIGGGALISKVLGMRRARRANEALEQARKDMSIYESL